MPLLLHASENGKSSLGCEAQEIKPSLEGGWGGLSLPEFWGLNAKDISWPKKIYICLFYIKLSPSGFKILKRVLRSTICFPIMYVKFGHSEKATKNETISHLIWHLISKRQIIWEIVSNFVAFLENLNFNGPSREFSYHYLEMKW